MDLDRFPFRLANQESPELIQDEQAAGGDTNQGAKNLPEDFHFLFVGRLRYYKGLDIAIRALAQLPAGRLRVVGSGPMEQEWKDLARTLGLEQRIDWLGDLDDASLPAAYRSCDAFVLPAVARSEAFGIVILEAMASGLPCLTTELGTGTSWVNQDGQTGYVVPARDPDSLANSMQSLLQSPQNCHTFALAARARVEQEFSLDRMIARVENIYQQVVAETE